jgi:hypothetical protein
MIAATPLHGSHYLTDVIGGVTTALFSILAAERILYAVLARVARTRRTGRVEEATEVLEGMALR